MSKYIKIICSECGEEMLAPNNNKKHGTDNKENWKCCDCKEDICNGNV